jgi:hypothetical protein
MKSLINGGCAGVNSPVAAMLFYSERTSLKKKSTVRPLPSEKTWQFGGTHRFSEIGVSDAASN